MDGAILPIELVEAWHLRSARRGECLAQARVKAVPVVAQRLDSIGSSLELTNRLANAALLQAAHELVGTDDI